MLVAFWIVSIITALAFLGAGVMKIVRRREALVTSGMSWAGDFASSTVKLIGAAEVLGALGLVLPPATRIATALAPTAGLALAILMIGASAIHVRRHESPIAPIATAVLALSSAGLGVAVLL